MLDFVVLMFTAALMQDGPSVVAARPDEAPPLVREREPDEDEEDDLEVRPMTPAEAACVQAARAQRLIEEAADREGAARVLIARFIDRHGLDPSLAEAEQLLTDQDDLQLAHFTLGWTRNRNCSVAP